MIFILKQIIFIKNHSHFETNVTDVIICMIEIEISHERVEI